LSKENEPKACPRRGTHINFLMGKRNKIEKKSLRKKNENK